MKARDAIEAIKTWSLAHTIATAAILGFLAGWLLPKLAALL